ncbi:hypothetical protein Psi01_21420 [Planobispora siamensis]|uniref:non-specific serine/threonine protein kinase n=1 Tax=Planobispora siamensis TaxID=936338 RepID=A0A8J3SEP5_9ACTN|nr:hypothetical protein Psi01_21420 [Planobispora siamensis]
MLADRYELITPLGRGTMGTVWRAHDRSLGRDVAIKEIRQEPGLSEAQRAELRERMIREGRTAARISHPSVATVHDAIIEDGSPWIIMELVQARSLEQVIEEEGPLPPRLVAEIGADLLGALRAAHAQGILHRDVKPGNVLITESGRVVLTDFGIAKAEGDTSLTQTGMVIGSPGYTAPERARGEHTGPESDLWSLGATLYFAVEGRPAYERSSVAETLAALMTESVDPPVQAGPLRPVLELLLEKDHTARLTAGQAAVMLRAVADTPSTEAVSLELDDKSAAKGARQPGSAGAKGAAAAAPATGDAESGTAEETARDEAEAAEEAGTGPVQVMAADTGAEDGTDVSAASQAAGDAGGTGAPDDETGPAKAEAQSVKAEAGADSEAGPTTEGVNPGADDGTGPASVEAESAEAGSTTAQGAKAEAGAENVKAGTGSGTGPTTAESAKPGAGAEGPEAVADSEAGPAVESAKAGADSGAGSVQAGTEAGPAAGDEEEFDADRTMIVIRPKNGLRLPGTGETPAAAPVPPAPPARPRPRPDVTSDLGVPVAGKPRTQAAAEAAEAAERGTPEPPPIDDSSPTPPHGFPVVSKLGTPVAGKPAGPGGPAGSSSDDESTAVGMLPGAGRPGGPAGPGGPGSSGMTGGPGGFPAPGPGGPGGPGMQGPGMQGPGMQGPGGPGPQEGWQPFPPGSGPGPSNGNHQPSGLGTDLFAIAGSQGGPVAPNAKPPGGKIGTLVLIGVAAVSMVIIMILVVAAFAETGAGDPTAANLSAGTSATSQSGTGGDAAPAASPDSSLSADLRRYEDAKGFSIDPPAPLRASTRGDNVVFKSEDDTRYLRVNTSAHASENVRASVKAAQNAAVRARTYPGYRLVGVTEVEPEPYAGANAADWEFTYVAGGETIHVLARFVNQPGKNDYAIYWAVPAASWDEQAGMREAVLASFRPAGQKASGGS